MKILITFKTFPEQRQLLEQFFEKRSELIFWEDHPVEMKKDLISEADILFTWNPEREGLYTFNNINSLQKVKFIQLFSAGYDHVKLDMFPPNIIIASNQGAFAEPMAEHVLAMMLSLSKKLLIYHNKLKEGKFDQLSSLTKPIKETVVGIIGFGSIGKETARLLRPFDVKILAINTTGKTNEDIEFIGTLRDLDYVLKNSDTLLISCPLTEQTNGLLNKQKLELMKEDAILINVARGEIINQRDFYYHLKTHPNFYAGIDAWWVEPFKDGKFEIKYPFFELPNLLGSPHNSAMVNGALKLAIEKAAANIERFINNGNATGIIR